MDSSIEAVKSRRDLGEAVLNDIILIRSAMILKSGLIDRDRPVRMLLRVYFVLKSTKW